MSQTANVSVQETNGASVWVPCDRCSDMTCHVVLAAVKVTDQTLDGDIQVWEDFLIIQCGGCKMVSFCSESSCTEDFEYDAAGNQHFMKSTNVYPSRVAGRAKLKHWYYLPQKVGCIYKETYTALCNKQPILAGIGIRAIVEAVCKEKAAAGNNLQHKIDSLVRMGMITPDGARILHSLRFMGNSAAHEVKAHTEEELSVAFDVIEYLVKGVFILPRIAQQLPNQ